MVSSQPSAKRMAMMFSTGRAGLEAPLALVLRSGLWIPMGENLFREWCPELGGTKRRVYVSLGELFCRVGMVRSPAILIKIPRAGYPLE